MLKTEQSRGDIKLQQMNKFKEKLKRGIEVLGTWSVFDSPSVAEVLAIGGFDFIIIDLEHGPADMITATNIVRSTESLGCSPLIRVPKNEDWMILRALESGCHGIVVPQINSVLDAKRAIEAIFYHPKGNRGFSPFTRSGHYGNEDSIKLSENHNANTVSCLLVESKEGIDDLDNICSLHDIDIVYLGIYDISQSIGHPGDSNKSELIKILKSSVQIISQHSIAPGLLVQNVDDVKRYREWGAKMFAYKADCAILIDAVKSIRNDIIDRDIDA